MLLMQPSLVDKEDLGWAVGHTDEDLLLQQTIETCLKHPNSKPVVIMRELEQKVDAKVFLELGRELNVLDETIDFSLEISGARSQLRDSYAQKIEAALLLSVSEKPLSALTENERLLLKSLGSKARQKRV